MRLAPRHRRPASAGFSLAELSVIIAMLGCLFMAGVPRLNQLTEQSKAAEAFVFLSHVAKAQERYRARSGEYARQIEDLDLSFRAPRWFVIGQGFSFDWETRWSQRLVRREPTSTDWQTKWEVKLTRSGASSGYGNYTMTYNEKVFRPGLSSIPQKLRTK